MNSDYEIGRLYGVLDQAITDIAVYSVDPLDEWDKSEVDILIRTVMDAKFELMLALSLRNCFDHREDA